MKAYSLWGDITKGQMPPNDKSLIFIISIDRSNTTHAKICEVDGELIWRDFNGVEYDLEAMPYWTIDMYYAHPNKPDGQTPMKEKS
jgi:hypothetical protein